MDPKKSGTAITKEQLLKTKQKKKEAKYLNSNQLNKLLNYVDHKYYHRIFEFAVKTGIKRGKIFGLQIYTLIYQKKPKKMQQKKWTIYYKFKSLTGKIQARNI